MGEEREGVVVDHPDPDPDPDPVSVPRRRKSLEEMIPEVGMLGQAEADAAAAIVANIGRNTRGFLRPRLQVEDVGLNCTIFCLVTLYTLVVVAILWDLYLLDSAADFSMNDSPFTAFPLTNDTQLFEFFNSELSPEGAETLANTGKFVSEDPPTIFPAEGGRFTVLYDEVDNSEYIAALWLSFPNLYAFHQLTLFLSMETPAPWTGEVLREYEALNEEFAVTVDAQTCWRGSNCDDGNATDFKLMTEELAVTVSGHTEIFDDSFGSVTLSRWFTAFQYTVASINTPFDKTYFSFRFRRNAASQAAFRINSDGYLGNCNATTAILCTPKLYAEGRQVVYGWDYGLLLLFLLVVYNVWWLCLMYRRNPCTVTWSREQKWLVVMAAGTFLVINPFSIADYLSPIYHYQLGYFSEVIMAGGTALLWASFAFFADAPSRPIKSKRGFYAPKIIFAASKFLTGVGIATCNYAEVWSSGSPGSQSFSTVPQSWGIGRLRAYASFIALNFSLLVLAFIWWFFMLHRGKKILKALPYSLTRSLQLQFRLFSSLITALILLFTASRCWWISWSQRGFVNASQNQLDYLTALQRFAMAAQSSQSGEITFAIASAFAAFVCCMQFFFMPARNHHRRPDRAICFVTERERLAAANVGRVRSGRLSILWHGSASRPAAPIPALVFETALFLLQLAKEAYRCFGPEELQQCLLQNPEERLINCELHDCDLLAAVCEPDDENVHDTHCLILRHRLTNRLVVSWRGTKSRKQVDTDLQASKAIIHTGVLLNRPPRSSLGPKKKSSKRNRRNEFLPYLDKLPDYLQQEISMSGRSLDSMMRGGSYSFMHAGFWGSYNRLRERVHATVLRELLTNPGELIVTGHSLGGALATICAYDLAAFTLPAVNAQLLREDAIPLPPLQVYTFGSPRVFSPHFAHKFDHAVPQCFRIICDGDVVPNVPTVWMGYSHCGLAVYIDNYGAGSVLVEPSTLEMHLQIRKGTALRVTAHLFPAYQKALEGCMSPIEDEEELRDIINEVYLRYSLKSLKKFSQPAAGGGRSAREEVDDDHSPRPGKNKTTGNNPAAVADCELAT